MMKKDEFQLFVKGKADKLDYSFATLIFAALALSVQFSKRLGSDYPLFLIGAWIFLMLAGCVGGWRITQSYVFDRLNSQQIHLKSFIQERRNPKLLQSVKQNLATDLDSGKTSIGQLMHIDDIRACALIAMVGFFSGAIQAPLTGIIIVMEMTDQHKLILPFLISGFLAQRIGQFFMPVSLYRFLAQRPPSAL